MELWKENSLLTFMNRIFFSGKINMSVTYVHFTMFWLQHGSLQPGQISRIIGSLVHCWCSHSLEKPAFAARSEDESFWKLKYLAFQMFEKGIYRIYVVRSDECEVEGFWDSWVGITASLEELWIRWKSIWKHWKVFHDIKWPTVGFHLGSSTSDD